MGQGQYSQADVVSTPQAGQYSAADVASTSQEPQVDQKMVDALHQAYDSRPLWRKVLGLEPDPDSLSPDLKSFQQQQRQAAVQHVTSSLQNQASGMKEGAIAGAKMAPFMMLGPAGEAVSGAVGGGGLGLAANAATQAVGAGAISKLEGASNTGAGINAALGAAGPVVGKGLEALGQSDLPERMYQSALKPSTTIPPDKLQQIVRTGLSESIPVSKGGLTKLSGLIEDVNDKISQEIAARPNVTIDPNNVAQRADQIIPTFRNQVNAGGDIADVKASKAQFLAEQGAKPAVSPQPTNLVNQYGQPITTAGAPAVPAQPMSATSAQAMKQGTYNQLGNRAYGELKGSTIEAQKALARGLKEELANAFPELSNLNARDSQFINLQDVLEKSVNRISNHQMLGIGTPMAAGAGKAITGSNAAAAVVGALKAVVDDPVVKSRLAMGLSRAGVGLPQALSRIGQFSNALAQYGVASSARPPGDQSSESSQ